MDDKSPESEAALKEAFDHIRRKLNMPTYATPQSVAIEAEIRFESERIAKNGILALSREVTELKDKLDLESKVREAAKELRNAVLATTPSSEDVACGTADRVARACVAVRDLSALAEAHG